MTTTPFGPEGEFSSVAIWKVGTKPSKIRFILYPYIIFIVVHGIFFCMFGLLQVSSSNVLGSVESSRKSQQTCLSSDVSFLVSFSYANFSILQNWEERKHKNSLLQEKCLSLMTITAHYNAISISEERCSEG